MKIFDTKLFGLDISQNNTDVRDYQLVNMRNFIIDRHGRLVKRSGLRLADDDNLFLYDKELNFNIAKRLKYKQVITPNKTSIDIFAYANKVYLYNIESNTFQLLYEAPGTAEVDIDTYLGHVLVVSHDSNLAILRNLQENVFIFSSSNNKVIRAKGDITSTTIDYEEEDSSTITGMTDIDVDQTNLFSLVSNSEGAKAKAITDPEGHGATEIETSDITVNTGNAFYGEASIFLGYDNPHWAKLTKISSAGFNAPFDNSDGGAFVTGDPNGTNEIGTQADGQPNQKNIDVFEITDEDIDDYTNGISTAQTYKVNRKLAGSYSHDVENGMYWGVGATIDSATGDYSNGLTAGEIKINGSTYATDAIGNFIPSGDTLLEWRDTQVYFMESVEMQISSRTSPTTGAITQNHVFTNVFMAYKGKDLYGDRFFRFGDLVSQISGDDLAPSTRYLVNEGLPISGLTKNVMIADAQGGADAVPLQDYILDNVYASSPDRDIVTSVRLIVSSSQSTNWFKVFRIYRTDTEPVLYQAPFRTFGTISLSGIVRYYGVEFPGAGVLTNVVSEISTDNQADWNATYTNGTNIKFRLNIQEINLGNRETKVKITTLLEPDEEVDKGLAVTFDFVQYQIQTRAFNPYIRFKTPLSNEITDKLWFGNYRFDRSTDPIAFQAGNDSIYKIDITVAATFTNKGGAGDEENDWEYRLTFAATDRYKVDLYSISKDNLDNKDLIATNYYDSISSIKFCKADIFYFWINDINTNNYLVGIRRSGEENIATRTLDVDTDAAIDLKSFISHTGRRLSLLVYGSKIDILFFDLIGNDIEIADTFTPSAKTISAIAVTATDKLSDIYIYYTDDTIAKVQIVTDETTGFFKFYREGSTIQEYTDNDDLDHYLTGSNTDKTKMAFVNTEQLEKKLLFEDSGTITGGSRYLEWQEGGASPTNWDKIISDEAAAKITQIKPVSTPIRPIFGTPSGSTLTGTYVYFFVVKEDNSSTSEEYYESYPSDISIKYTVSGSDIILDLSEDYSPFTLYSTTNLRATLYVYRYKVAGTAKELRITDFRLINSSGTALTLSGEKFTLTGTITDNVSDATLSTKEKYRGYSTYYPRCKFVEVYNNVVYQANDNKYSNNIYFSELFDPTSWSPQLALSASEFTNNPITGLIKSDGLYIFTRDEVHLLTGIGTDITKQLLTKQIGCVDNRTIQVIDRKIIFLSERGLYAIQGYNWVPIDSPVERLTGEFTFASGIVSFFDRANREYKIVYDKNKVLSYSFPMQTWFISEYPYDKILLAFVRENPSTDLWETMFVVENTTDEEGKRFLLLVEDERINYDHLAVGNTQNIVSEIYSKHYDMGNPYAKKIWRRLHLDLVRTHDIECFVSTDDGEYVEMNENVRRKYFNGLPYIWFRFDELFGKIRDYGSRGGTADALNIKRDVDGKIDRSSEWSQDESSEVKIRNVRTLTENPCIGFWHKTNKRNFANLQEENLVLNQDDGDYSEDFEVGEPYTAADFPSTSDTGGISSPSFDTFNPGIDSNGDAVLRVGEMNFDVSAIGYSVTFTGRGASTNGGNFRYTVGDILGATWSSFTTDGDGGQVTMQIPKIGIGEMAIGSTFVVA